MEFELIDFISTLPLHALLLIAIVVLWRENQKLRDQIEQVRKTSAGNTALLLNQSDALSTIEAHIKGSTPDKGMKPVESQYEASPPYRKQK